MYSDAGERKDICRVKRDSREGCDQDLEMIRALSAP